MKEDIHRPGPSGGEHRPRSNAVHNIQHVKKAQDDEEDALRDESSGDVLPRIKRKPGIGEAMPSGRH